jgi:hypothetical protein
MLKSGGGDTAAGDADASDADEDVGFVSDAEVVVQTGAALDGAEVASQLVEEAFGPRRRFTDPGGGEAHEESQAETEHDDGFLGELISAGS